MVSQFPASNCLWRHNLQPKNRSVSGDLLPQTICIFTYNMSPDTFNLFLETNYLYLSPIFMPTICLETYNLTPEKFSTYKSVSGDTISSYKMSPETQFPTKKCPHRPTNKHLKFHVGLLNPLEAQLYCLQKVNFVSPKSYFWVSENPQKPIWAHWKGEGGSAACVRIESDRGGIKTHA